MPTRRWTARYRDHEIVLHNRFSLVSGIGRGALIEVDGTPVLRGAGRWMDGAARIAGPVELSGERVLLEGLVGWDVLTMRGQIRVDGALIGGDASMGSLEPAALARILGNPARFLLVESMLQWGLPFGFGMTVVNVLGGRHDVPSILMWALFHTSFFGLSMGLCHLLLNRRAFRRLYPGAVFPGMAGR